MMPSKKDDKLRRGEEWLKQIDAPVDNDDVPPTADDITAMANDVAVTVDVDQGVNDQGVNDQDVNDQDINDPDYVPSPEDRTHPDISALMNVVESYTAVVPDIDSDVTTATAAESNSHAMSEYAGMHNSGSATKDTVLKKIFNTNPIPSATSIAAGSQKSSVAFNKSAGGFVAKKGGVRHRYKLSVPPGTVAKLKGMVRNNQKVTLDALGVKNPVRPVQSGSVVGASKGNVVGLPPGVKSGDIVMLKVMNVDQPGSDQPGSHQDPSSTAPPSVKKLQSIEKMTTEERKVYLDAQKTHGCSKCPRVFRTHLCRTIHEELHTMKTVSFRCETCKKGFINENAYKKHKQSHVSLQFYECHSCHPVRQYDTYVDLRRHMRVHTGEPPYECDFCSQVFTEFYVLTKHREHHEKERRPHKCPDCRLQYATLEELEAHRPKHTNDRPFVCEHCAKAFRRADAMQRHILVTHTKTLKYKCPICPNKNFVDDCTLQKHIELHKGLKNFTCEFCEKKMTQVSYKQHRKLNHAAGKKVPCKVCKVEFPTKCLLRIHFLQHGPEDNVFHCPHCNKLLPSAHYVNIHIRDSSSRGVRTCIACSQSFNERCRFLKHLYNAHTIYQYATCRICNFISRSYGGWAKHMLEVHGDDVDPKAPPIVKPPKAVKPPKVVASKKSKKKPVEESEESEEEESGSEYEEELDDRYNRFYQRRY